MATSVLTRPVLILNSRWQPISTATVQEAIGLVAKGSAHIIEPDTYEVHDLNTWNDVSRAKKKFEHRVIRSMSLSLIPPEVIVLTEYDGIGERGVVFSRRNLFKRDKFTCQYCGIQPGPSELTIDHVIPKVKGGRSSFENCVLACVSCNKTKADKSVQEAGMTLKKKPSKPSWKSLATAATSGNKLESWSKFISDAYWDTELES